MPEQTTTKRRRASGLYFIVVAFIFLAIVNYSPSVTRVHCNDEELAKSPEVIMLSTWWCPYCNQARRYFSDNNISYCEFDIEQSTEGERRYTEVNGRGVPVILIGDYVMGGFDERRFEQLLQHARHANEQEPGQAI